MSPSLEEPTTTAHLEAPSKMAPNLVAPEPGMLFSKQAPLKKRRGCTDNMIITQNTALVPNQNRQEKAMPVQAVPTKKYALLLPKDLTPISHLSPNVYRKYDTRYWFFLVKAELVNRHSQPSWHKHLLQIPTQPWVLWTQIFADHPFPK